MNPGRETFYELQARHRRAAARWSVASAATALVLAIAAGLVMTPALIVGLLAGARGLHAVTPLPEAWWARVRGTRDVLDSGARAVMERRYVSPDTAAAAPAVVPLLAPGTLLVLIVWRRQRAALMRATAATMLADLSPRPLDRLALEERQLSNIVDEMAIAAGLPAPRVFLSAGVAPTAAIAGSNIATAAIVVSESTLTMLGRAETQALIAQATASIVNGDLALNLETAAVARTYSRLMAWLQWPFNAGPIRLLLFLPLTAMTLVAQFFVILVTLFLLVPVIGWLHRHRWYLADATAVQLTRDPGALARALVAGDAPRVDGPLMLAGVRPPVSARLARLHALGAPGDIRATVPAAAWRRPTVSEVAGMAIVLAICSPFILYLVTVAVLFAGGAAIGAYWLAFWTASRLIP